LTGSKEFSEKDPRRGLSHNTLKSFSQGLLISDVDPQGIASEVGIEPGDRVISVDGRDIKDILDFQYETSEEAYTLVVAKKDPDEIWEIDIECSPEESLGVAFADVAVDGLKVCRNNCVFCFIRQMPPGLRSSLYEYDDDYRMSVSRGNYITLTNLQEEEFERILDMGISPLYISVHAWNPGIRARMMGNPEAAKLPGHMTRLAQGGIEMHTQIVLVPGCNDGDALHHTVHQLAGLYPRVLSIGVVPVGLTRFRSRLDSLRGLTPRECEGILDKGETWQKDFRRRHGKNLVYFADEFYLACGRDVPLPWEYDGFEQIENGIGMLSAFWDELQSLLNTGFAARKDSVPGSAPDMPDIRSSRHLITGVLVETFLHK
jgi:putative radical SAM enzyme (TIGR03279 family)